MPPRTLTLALASMSILARTMGQPTRAEVPELVVPELALQGLPSGDHAAPACLPRKGARKVLAERRRQGMDDLLRTGLNRQSRRILARRTRLAPA